MKYIANPVEVDAFVILDVIPVMGTMPADMQGWKINYLSLKLDDGRMVQATKEMCARYTPQVGDYWVVQSDGYVYLNPKDVFERKYHAVGQ